MAPKFEFFRKFEMKADMKKFAYFIELVTIFGH